MRVQISINVAGDMRLQTLADKVDIRVSKGCASTPLVCSAQVEELVRLKKPRSKAGFGELASRATFTKYAKCQVRQAGACLDAQPRKQVVFLTGTLPGSTPEAVRALACWSAWVIRTTRQWLRDAFQCEDFLGVWEYQRRGALHLHLCVACPSTEAARNLKRRWKQRWIKLLDTIAERSSVDVYQRTDGSTWRCRKWVTRTDAQTVEKSVANYLGKYLSKGAGAVRRACAIPPSAWYCVSASLKSKIQEGHKMLVLHRLTSGASLRLFERLAGVVAEQECLAFLYRSPIDVLQKGLIALMKPIQASMVYERLRELVYPIMNETSSLCVNPKDDIPSILRMFDSLKWVHT